MSVDTSAPLRDIVNDFRGKNAEELHVELNKIPFFMTEFDENEEENLQIEALRAMAYEGEPWEIANNFKRQGNECFKSKKFKDAIQFYTQALDQKTEKIEINIACLGNRAQCNLELKNYRRCITDCTRVLDLDNSNIKAWYRSAKAFLLLDKADECLACCERGLEVDGVNKSLLHTKLQAEKRSQRRKELAVELQRRKEETEEKARTLQLALAARKFTFKYTISNHGSSNMGDVRPTLEDPLDANSCLYLPVLALYPAAMESDILQSVDENATVVDILEQLFAVPPSWADPAKYSLNHLEAYAQTESGGIAKLGRKTTLRNVFGTPNVIMIDNMARICIIPKSDTPAWIKSWNKEAQLKLLRN